MRFEGYRPRFCFSLTAGVGLEAGGGSVVIPRTGAWHFVLDDRLT